MIKILGCYKNFYSLKSIISATYAYFRNFNYLWQSENGVHGEAELLEMVSLIKIAFRSSNDVKYDAIERKLTKLFAQIDSNNLEILKEILDESPKNILNIPMDGQYAIHRAVQLNRLEILEYLLAQPGINKSSKCLNGDSIWHAAMKTFNPKVIDFMLKNVEPCNATNKQKESVLDLVVRHNNFELLQRFLDAGFKKVNLFDATGNTKIFAELVSRIKSLNIYGVNDSGQTLLHSAVRNGNVGLVRSFLVDGFDVNQVDSEGRAPIHMAIKARDLNMVIFLFTNRAVLKPARKLWAPKTKFIPVLHEAIDYDDPAIISYLIRNGADVNIQDPSGMNAVALAVKRKLSESVLKELIDAGSDPLLQDKMGKSALQALRDNHNMMLFIYNQKRYQSGFDVPEIVSIHQKLFCPICKEDVAESEPVYMTKCKHDYHKTCLDFWFESSLKCPQCISQIITPSINK